MKFKQKIKPILAGFIFLVFPYLTFAQADPLFNPNKLVEDSVFADTETFGGAEGVQKFLESKKSVLANTSLDFLVKLKEPPFKELKQKLDDPNPSLSRLRTAAELIWDASRHSGLNAQVILVTLNKEQGLITAADTYSDSRLQKGLDNAMGFGCPDSAGCGDLFPGFYFQLFGNLDASGNRYMGSARSLMKSFSSGGTGPFINGRLSRVGDVVVLPNNTKPHEVSPQQSLQIANRATAALYRYTPWVFNGNYNFWRFFNEWFKYPNGTIFSLLSGGNTYIIQNGSRYFLPDFVAVSRKLDLGKKIIISPTEVSNYPEGGNLGPADNTVVKDSSGKLFVFLNNEKRPASEFVIGQRGLKAETALAVSQAESDLFKTAQVLPPQDGTVFKGKVGKQVFLAENGQVLKYSEFVFKQRKIKSRDIYPVPDEEIGTYSPTGFVPPLNGTVIKSGLSPAVYVVENGLKRPLTAEIYKNLGIRKVETVSSEELESLGLGAHATPKERTFFSVGSKAGQLYIFKEGSKHSISKMVAKQRGITPDYIFGENIVSEWLEGIPVPPTDNTAVKGDQDSTVYLVVKAQLRPLTATAFNRRKIKTKKVMILAQAEVDSYAKGEVLEK